MTLTSPPPPMQRLPPLKDTVSQLPVLRKNLCVPLPPHPPPATPLPSLSSHLTPLPTHWPALRKRGCAHQGCPKGKEQAGSSGSHSESLNDEPLISRRKKGGSPEKTLIGSECEKHTSSSRANQIPRPRSWQTLLINLGTQGSPELHQVLLVPRGRVDTFLPSLLTQSLAGY